MISSFLLLVILLPAAGGLIEFLLGRRTAATATGAGRAVVTAALLNLIPGAILAARVAAGTGLAGYGLRADAMGIALTLLISLLGAVGLAYARHHLRAEVAAGRAKAHWLPTLFGCSGLFMAAGIWAAVTDHLIVLYIAVEATTLATALPVAFYRKRTSWEATYKYLLLNTLGLTAGLLGLGLIAAGGHTLNLSALETVTLSPTVAAVAGGLLIIGFGTKAGLMPMHAWLPDAYQESPGGFIALFAGTGTKVAALALARVLPPLVLAAPGLRTALLVIAAATMLLGIAAAFVQDDLRRMLGYSSVSQMGYIAMALAVGGTAGYSAATYHMVSHGLIKALLFLCVGELWSGAGTARISGLSGKSHPRFVGPIFLVAAAGLGGVPPMPTFWSKFQVILATANTGYAWAAGVAIVTSLLTITTLVWAGARVFLLQEHAAPRSEAPAPRTAWLLGLAVVVLFAAGAAPGWITQFLSQIGG